MSPPFSLSNLEPPFARLCLEVEKRCQRSLSILGKANLLLALSGGADSTAMAYILSLIAARNNYSLSGIYINHHIRPEAAKEALFVENLCQSLSIPYFYDEFKALDMAKMSQIGLEEAGRKGRYFLLENCRQRIGADYILVAHHLGDLSEDILMRLIRGAGWPALGGMRGINGRIFRPLLHIARNRLISFLSSLNQDWCEDLSNQDLSCRRNRLRARIIPFLKMENPSIERSFNNLHTLSQADEEFWQNYLQEIFEEYPLLPITNDFGEGFALLINAVTRQPLSVRLRLYYDIINKLGRIYPDYTKPQAQFEKLVSLDTAIQARRSGKIFQFQGGLTVQLYKTRISFLLQKKRGSAS